MNLWVSCRRFYEKKNIIIILILLVLPIISAVAVTETRFQSTDYDIFVNDTITLDKARVTNNSIEFYNITSTGIFTNLGTADAIISFYGLTDPNNDFSWGNGTKFLFGQTDVNITIPPNHYLVLGDYGDPTPKGGGGTGYNPKLSELNATICNYTYYHLLEYGNSSVSISLLRDSLEENNISISIVKLRDDYVLPYQGLCSEIVNRTLRPEFVCLSIENYVTTLNKTITNEDVLELEEEIDEVIPITPNLLTYYIQNFNEVCSKFYVKPLSIATDFEEESSAIILIMIAVFVVIILLITQKKKVMVYLKRLSG